MADVSDALRLVMASHGREMAPGRIKTVALLILDQGWKRAELREAARQLASSPELRDRIRFGGTITPADFEEIRRGDEREDEGRIITTYRGFALKVRKAKLYEHAEMMGLWKAVGCPGVVADSRTVAYPNSMFTFVDVAGRPWWRLK